MRYKLCSPCLFFPSSLPSERLKVLACLNALREQCMDVMKVAPARGGRCSGLRSAGSPSLPPLLRLRGASWCCLCFAEPCSGEVGGLWKATLTRRIAEVIGRELYVGTWRLWEIKWADELFEVYWEAPLSHLFLCRAAPWGFY